MENHKAVSTAAVLAALLLMFTGCDKGLSPDEGVKEGIDGTVTFAEGWNQESGVNEGYVLVFKNIPADTDEAYNEFLRGNIHTTALTPPFRAQYDYHFDLDAGTYALVVCVGIKGESFFDIENWILAGYYTGLSGILPSQVTVPEGARAEGIDITASVISPYPLPF